MGFNFSFDNLKVGFLKFQEQIYLSVEEKELSKEQADYICDHLQSESESHTDYEQLLAQNVKSWKNAWNFVKSQARKQAINGCAMIDDIQVLNWIDEYLQATEDKEKEPIKTTSSKKITTNKTKQTKSISSSKEKDKTEKEILKDEQKEIKIEPKKRGRKAVVKSEEILEIKEKKPVDKSVKKAVSQIKEEEKIKLEEKKSVSKPVKSVAKKSKIKITIKK